MKLHPALVVGATGLALGACSTPGRLTDADMGDGPATADVIRQVKAELGEFALRYATPETRPGSCLSNFALTVTSADIQLTTTATTTGDLNGGISRVPLLSGALKAQGALATSDVASATTTFRIRPLDEKLTSKDVELKGKPVWSGRPIYRTLSAIRQSLIDASDQKPCIKLEDGANAVKLGFALTKKASGAAGFDILVFSLAADASRQLEHQNTITVSFDALGDSMMMQSGVRMPAATGSPSSPSPP